MISELRCSCVERDFDFDSDFVLPHKYVYAN